MLAYCDRFGRLIGDDVFDGARGCSVSLSYRRLLHGALANGARAMIVVHNHPSGKAIPSQEDIVSTRSLSALSCPMQVVLIDHLIVGRSAVFSMRSAGLLE